MAEANDAPIAVDDSFDGDEGSAITGNVLIDNGNGADSDPDGDSLAVVSGTYGTTHGSVTIQSDGTFVYTAEDGYTGTDSFEYTVTDGTDTDTAMVTLTLNGSTNYIVGTDRNDVLKGGDNADIIEGGGGNDRLYGNDGDDYLYGDDGNDRLYGNDGDDYLYGGEGNDRLNGGAGDDYLYGGEGNDRLNGGAGDDYLYGGNGRDVLNGGNGNDYIYGGDGRDTLIGGGGDDVIYGESGNDFIHGASGNNSLYGGSGDDQIIGGSGNNIISGGAGNDYLIGISGYDTFIIGEGSDWVYSSGRGDTFVYEAIDSYVDTVYGFTAGEHGDTLDLSDILTDYDPVTDDISNFVEVTSNNWQTSISVNADGVGDDFVAIAKLYFTTGINDAEAMIDSGNLVV